MGDVNLLMRCQLRKEGRGRCLPPPSILAGSAGFPCRRRWGNRQAFATARTVAELGVAACFISERQRAFSFDLEGGVADRG
jgi:hypothetical protein